MQHGLASSTQGFVETSSRPGDILEAGFLSLQRRKDLPFIPIVWGMIQTVQEEILEKKLKISAYPSSKNTICYTVTY